MVKLSSTLIVKLLKVIYLCLRGVEKFNFPPHQTRQNFKKLGAF